MIETIKNIEIEVKNFEIINEQTLENFRLQFLSKKGKISELFEVFKTVSGEQKKEVGKTLNELRILADEKFNSFKVNFQSSQNKNSQEIDYSLPVNALQLGTEHPINKVKNEIISIFQTIGFSIAYGPEIEDEWHNFSSLNFAENHPARDMQDTFFVDKNPQGNFALRTHTSSVQIRLMEKMFAH
jgi:phenylalanyl-tRNA synthetase alpha chain